jgi:hypothetical protein
MRDLREYTFISKIQSSDSFSWPIRIEKIVIIPVQNFGDYIGRMKRRVLIKSAPVLISAKRAASFPQFNPTGLVILSEAVF